MTMVVPTYLPCHPSHFPLPLKRRILPHDQWNQWKTLLLRIPFFLFLLVESTFLQRPSARQDCMSVPVRQKSFSETKWSSEPLRAFVRNKLLKAAVESTVRRLRAFTSMDIISPCIGVLISLQFFNHKCTLTVPIMIFQWPMNVRVILLDEASNAPTH